MNNAIKEISIENRIHNGFELPCYIPKLNGKPVFGEHGYILKNSFNPLIICNECGGIGCKNCKSGLRKGKSIDLLHLAQLHLDLAIAKL